MRAHPTPERVADINVGRLEQAALLPLQGEAYLIGAGETVAKGELDIEDLPEARPSRRRRN